MVVGGECEGWMVVVRVRVIGVVAWQHRQHEGGEARWVVVLATSEVLRRARRVEGYQARASNLEAQLA
jgi:hypothetical protein